MGCGPLNASKSPRFTAARNSTQLGCGQVQDAIVRVADVAQVHASRVRAGDGLDGHEAVPSALSLAARPASV